jgi:O-antigen/teichoic acid export membrane protein
MVTGGAQIFVSGTAILSGIIIVRLLSVEEYAYYTLANTMLSTMTLLADGGISAGVLAEGGKHWKDKQKLGEILTTGLYLRKRFALFSLLISIPILVYLLIEHNASILTCTLVSLAIIPAFLAALSDTLYEVPLKLHQDINKLQLNQFLVSLGRLVLTLILLLIFPFTVLALIAYGIPRSIGNLNLKKLSGNLADSHQKPNGTSEKQIMQFVKKIMPTTIYYCISGQITIWLISFLGSTATLASFGALGRISSISAILSTIIATLIIPRFARLERKKELIFKMFALDQILIFLPCLSFVLGVYFFSDWILYVLGNDYSGLNYELLLIAISSGLSVMSKATNGLLNSRGMIIPPAILISVTILVQVSGVFVFQVSTMKGIIYYSIATVGVLYIMRLIFFLILLVRNKF